MIQQINDFIIDLKGAFWHMTLAAMLFILVGYYMPKIYLDYFDTNKYYSLELPIKVDKKIYMACDKVIWNMVRTSKADIDAMATVELILLKDNVEVSRELIPLAAEKGTLPVSTYHKLPCDLESGEYKYNGIVSYEYKGNIKHYHFYTENFFVEEFEEGGI